MRALAVLEHVGQADRHTVVGGRVVHGDRVVPLVVLRLTLFSETIKTPDTIPRLLALQRIDDSKPNSNSAIESSTTPIEAQGPSTPYLIVFAQLNRGINGFRDTLHGGVLAALFDEVLGMCAECYRLSHAPGKAWLLTASLEIQYRGPVSTPGPVCVRTWIERWEGRKWFLKCEMVDEGGVVRAEGRSLYVASKDLAHL